MSERSSKNYSTNHGLRRRSPRDLVPAMLFALAPTCSGSASDNGDSIGQVIVSIRSSAMPSSVSLLDSGDAQLVAYQFEDSNEVFSLGELKPVPKPTASAEASDPRPTMPILLPVPSDDLYPSTIPPNQPSVVRVRASDSVIRRVAPSSELPQSPIPSASLEPDSSAKVNGSQSDPGSLRILSDSSRGRLQEALRDNAPESFEVGPVEWDNQPQVKNEFDFDSASVHSTLRIPLHASQSIRFGGKVLRTVPENRTVCRSIVSGVHEVALISRNAGITRVAVELEDRNGRTKPIVLQVEVAGPWSQSETNMVRDLGIIEQTIREIHQDSQVSIVRNKDGSLIVAGTAASEASARSILSMVRRVCLVPIKDQIVVRPRN